MFLFLSIYFSKSHDYLNVERLLDLILFSKKLL